MSDTHDVDDLMKSISLLSREETMAFLRILVENAPPDLLSRALNQLHVGKQREDYDQLNTLLDNLEQNLETLSSELLIDQSEANDLYQAFRLLNDHLAHAKARPEQIKRFIAMCMKHKEGVIYDCDCGELIQFCLLKMGIMDDWVADFY